ncbi:MAG: phosphoribosylformylglycinamidine synthase [Clostridia bacterium]|nr:phosphoribosylformylglycinamidine synthase [Clostridia bacterium]
MTLDLNTVRRIFVEKKPGFDVEANGLLKDIKENLLISSITGLKIVNRYDIQGVTDEEYKEARNIIFSEPPVDTAYDEEYPLPAGATVIATEFLPGQYDQRAASAAECVQLLTKKERPKVRAAKLIVLLGDVSKEDVEKIKKYIINPVESHEAELIKPLTLEMKAEIPADIEIMEGFTKASDAELAEMIKKYGFAMDLDDIKFCREYFAESEKRNPSMTEMRMIDTYWSDHCRHTTFLTKLQNIEFADNEATDKVKEVFGRYVKARETLYVEKKKDITLMDVATIAAKELKKAGYLKELDQSEEINACSIEADVDVDGRIEKWLIMFKNETHNHPTEIEPFGGAATCLGGAIRDPLSGRSYVYQAMRVTGSGDPNKTLAETVSGKLMQRKISKGAAAGYSSYGNQIGLATGQVTEIYDEGYVAKRMEIGAVIAAAPKENVVRERPEPTDIIVLLGGRTGRDGCGGATGSSKAHTEESLETCGAEVQKGNAPEERKLQRLFRNGEVTRLIKRCNDFGAGGVSVAIGELADGLVIDLDKVPKKYEGLGGTELAISESQERMAVVVAKENVEKFVELAHTENLEATVVAEVTDTNRLKMLWRGKAICDISRDFLNTNGATKVQDAFVEVKDASGFFKAENTGDVKEKYLSVMGDLNVASQKGLCEMFDSSIGRGTVIMPFGGKYRLTPNECMAAKVPVLHGETTTATLMSFGYNPVLSKLNPFMGAVYAVVESVAKIVAAGGDYKKIYLTFQEYFERLNNDDKRWGKPLAALLGAYLAQTSFKIAAIGGKDSMSGSFNDLDVPPTLVSFAVDTANAKDIVTGDLKSVDSDLYEFRIKRDKTGLPDFEALMKMYDEIHKLVLDGKILSSYTVRSGGVAEALAKMSFGSRIGVSLCESVKERLFDAEIGSIIVEVQAGTEINAEKIGKTTNEEFISVGEVKISIDELLAAWEKPLEAVYPTKTAKIEGKLEKAEYTKGCPLIAKSSFAKPRVFIPVFPGTNCEYDTMKAFNKAGAESDIFVIKNLTASDITDSVKEMTKRINESQIIMIPGGFSAGDEPEGSGKFIATVFRNPDIKEAVMNLLKNRDGLMLGICNGFQALIKLGLVPYGEIRDLDADSPTLTYNKIGRHVSQTVYTRICSNLSPWLSGVNVGDVHSISVSHGEGRFVADEKWIEELAKNGQIATQYVDMAGVPSYETSFNPNGSVNAIEGITSPCGRILGKMGHSERIGKYVAKNVYGDQDQKIFESGVKYFK